MVYTKEEIYDEICKFVTAKPRRTINQVVEHIYNPNNQNMCAKQTAEDRVRELIGNRLIDNQSREGGFHSLQINDKNEFVNLGLRIDKLHSLAINLTKVVTNRVKGMAMIRTRFPKTIGFDTDFRNLVHLAQLHLYGMISQVSRQIGQKVESTSDREVLYLRLVKVLDASDKLNKVIEPEILRGIDEMLENMEKGHVVGRWANTVQEIGKTMKEFLV